MIHIHEIREDGSIHTVPLFPKPTGMPVGLGLPHFVAPKRLPKPNTALRLSCDRDELEARQGGTRAAPLRR